MKATHEQKKPGEHLRQRIKNWTKAIALKAKQSSLTDWLLVCLTSFYLLATLLMWQAMRDSNEESQRAWLLVKALTPLVPQKDDGRCPIVATDQRPPDKDLPPPPQPIKPEVTYCVMITLENTGNSSPATATSIAGWAATREQEREFFRNPPFNPSIRRQSRSVVGSKHSSFLIIPDIGGKDFIPEVIREIERGERRLYLYGRIDYLDTFNAARETKFCAAYVPASRGFDFCEAYNEVK